MIGDNHFMSEHTLSHIKPVRIPVSIGLAKHPHILMICYNTTNYLICNKQDFRYWLCTSILNCFGQLVSPLCYCMTHNHPIANQFGSHVDSPPPLGGHAGVPRQAVMVERFRNF